MTDFAVHGNMTMDLTVTPHVPQAEEMAYGLWLLTGYRCQRKPIKQPLLPSRSRVAENGEDKTETLP
ncbi:MAG: hypothetical protein H5T68_01840 [Chloroflexi bacterium]|nr:hypothetical protein [Chloroflexota bacterium]